MKNRKNWFEPNKLTLSEVDRKQLIPLKTTPATSIIKLGVILVLVLLGNADLWANNEVPELFVIKKKNLVYSYTLRPNDRILVDNQFGDVKMKLWDQEVIKVEVLITATAPTEAKALEFLKITSVKTSRFGNEVSFKTEINNRFSPYTNNVNVGNSPDGVNKLRVDYLVYLPKNHPVTIDNSFGDVYLPEFEAAVKLSQQYGTLFAEHIRNLQSDVTINNCTAYIKSMHGGGLKAEYSDLKINEMNNIRLENNHGRLQVKQFVDVEGIISYSSGVLENVKEAARLTIDFSDGLKFHKIDKDVTSFELDCNYSTMDLPMTNLTDFSFEVKSNNGKVHFPTNKTFNFLQNSETDKATDDKSVYRNNFYFGTMGNADNKTKVIIKSNYGVVRIK